MLIGSIFKMCILTSALFLNSFGSSAFPRSNCQLRNWCSLRSGSIQQPGLNGPLLEGWVHAPFFVHGNCLQEPKSKSFMLSLSCHTFSFPKVADCSESLPSSLLGVSPITQAALMMTQSIIWRYSLMLVTLDWLESSVRWWFYMIYLPQLKA